MHRARVSAYAFASASVLSTGIAVASPSAKLVYVRGAGAETCPGTDELRKAVASRIGYDPFFLSAPKTVLAQVDRTPDGYRGRVQIVGDDGNSRGERELASRGDDCAELVRAIALAVSLALDDVDEAAPSPPAPAPTPSPHPRLELEPEPDPAVEPPPAVAPAPPSRASSFRVRASAGPVLSLGSAPATALGASAAVSLENAALGARLGFRGELPAADGGARGGTVSTRLLLATLGGCIRGAVPFGCVGAGLGSLRSRTEGITRTATDSALLVVGVATAGADIALGRTFYAEPFVEAVLNPRQVRIVVDGATARSLPQISGTFGVHLGARFR